jgi:hypothetical protein
MGTFSIVLVAALAGQPYSRDNYPGFVCSRAVGRIGELRVELLPTYDDAPGASARVFKLVSTPRVGETSPEVLVDRLVVSHLHKSDPRIVELVTPTYGEQGTRFFSVSVQQLTTDSAKSSYPFREIVIEVLAITQDSSRRPLDGYPQQFRFSLNHCKLAE